jgi:hypothetical protein
MNRFIFVCFVFFSCSTNEDALNARIAELESLLDDCQNGPQAYSQKIKDAFEGKDFQTVKQLFSEMEGKHSGSPLFAESKEIFNNVVAEEEKLKLEADKKESEEKALKLKSLEKLRKTLDDVSGTTWYKNPYFTHYSNSNLTSLYMGNKDGNTWVRLEMSYYGDDWIFFEKAYLSYEGNTKEVIFDRYKNKETENDGGKVWEWIDVQVDEPTMSFLRSLAQSNDAKMRLSGKYSKTRNLSSNERKAILDILDGYEALVAAD